MYNILNFDIGKDTEMLTDSTSYLIKIEMVDGTTQVAQITKEQAITLGIEIGEGTDLRNIEHTFLPPAPTRSTRYNYKIVHPEDLNLRPSNAALRGRPKKRIQEEVKEKSPPPKVIKPARTRSGRITRPPIHMEKDFEKILTDVGKSDDSSNNEVSTTEFQPLKTNDEPPVRNNQVVAAPIEKKKRVIPSQYRCSTCRKAYLGRNRMVQHLKKHPDHGIENQLVIQDSETWDFLIETSLKATGGQKGSKFCKEIINLIRNARTLVKYFFKPARSGRSEYYVDAFLSSILNIQEGEYRFNENELCKDISIFSFLEFFDDTFAHIIKPNDSNQTSVNNNGENAKPALIECKREASPIPNESVEEDIEHQANIDLHFGSDILDVIKETSKPPENSNDDNNEINSKEKDFLFSFHNNDKQNTKQKSKDFTNIFDCTNVYANKKPVEKSGEKQPDKSKVGFINLFDCTEFTERCKDKHFHNLFDVKSTNNPPAGSILSDLSNNVYAPEVVMIVDPLSTKQQRNNKDVAKSDVMLAASHSNYDDVVIDKKIDKKSDVDYDLHKLHLLSADISDEFILPDAGPSTLMDTSSNSDDIMNVDQFVNERFKRLTESDNLELPALDCFNFSS